LERFTDRGFFQKNAACHYCRKKQFVVGCYTEHYPDPECHKMYCLSCLEKYFRENIIEIVENEQTWVCPYKRKICRCNACASNEFRNRRENSEANKKKPIINNLKDKVKKTLEFNSG
jgi:hypothetical protein